MQRTILILSCILFYTGPVDTQQELAPSADSGPLTIGHAKPRSDEPPAPQPDEHGVYRLSAGIVVPALVRAMPAVASADDIPECSPPEVLLSAVIRVDGHAEIRHVFSPRSSPCANLAIQTVKKSIYQPAKLNGQPIAIIACVSMAFLPDQPVIPSIRRCPSNSEDARLPEDDTSGESEKPASRPTAEGLTPPMSRGPQDFSSAEPVPDQEGVYSMGPGIVAPVLLAAPQAGPPEALTTCGRGTLVAAVAGADGTVKVRGIYQSSTNACDSLAIAAIEQTRLRPATLNGMPVAALVCMGVPFNSRIVPPVPRTTYCPRDMGATPIGDAEAFRPRPGTKLPIVIFGPSAEYSREARKKKVEGTVVIELIVDEEGLPSDFHVVKSLGHGLDENAIAAARRYRFRPATFNGKSVPVRTTIDLDFRLQMN